MKDVGHLTAETYDGLLRGSLPPDRARALARHLEEPCASCEAFLAGRSEGDALDGRVDAALGALGPPGASGNDLEFARIERRLRGEGPAPAKVRPARFLAGAMAASLLAAGIVGLLLPRPEGVPPAWDGLKGTAPTWTVRLRFLVLAPDPGGSPRIEKGVPGQAVSAGSSLQFEVETARAARATLVRVAARGAPEVVWSEQVGEGSTAVSVAGRPAAYPLADLSGPQRFVLLVSEEDLDEARLAAVAGALAPSARAAPSPRLLGGLSLDVVEVDVR